MSSKKPAKVRDKWRMKSWYSIQPPPIFGKVEVASIPALDEARMVGRIVESTLYNITRGSDLQQMNIKLQFQVVGFQGLKAETVFKGHEYGREFLRSLVRRGGSRIDGIFTVTTKDGYTTRIYAIAISRRRVSPSRETAIRGEMQKIAVDKAANLTYDQLAQELVFGKVGSEVYNRATKIAPLRHAGIRKSKLIAIPTESFQPPTPTPSPPQASA